MKIVYIPDVGETYGAATSFKELVLTMRSEYNIIPIVLTSKKGKMYEEFKKNNIEVYAIGHKAFFVSKGSTILRKVVKTLLFPYYYIDYKISNYFAIKKAENKIDFSQIDMIHTNVNRNDIGAILARKYCKRHIWHIREFGKEDYDCYSLRRNYIKFMNENTDLFIAISNAVSQSWTSKGLDINKIKVIYNGVDTNRFKSNIKSHSNQKNENIKIIMSGAITPSKGQIQAIKALSLIPVEIRKIIKLDLYGTAAKEYFNYLKKYIKKLDLCENITFKGYKINIEEVMPNYDIGLVCSKSEGFGRVTIEYMLSNVCVVASNTGANPELVKDGENGLIYTLNDSEDLANKIVKLINVKGMMEEFKKKGYDYALNGFSKEKNAESIYNEYKKILMVNKNC